MLPRRTQPGDDHLIAVARAGIEALNHTYSDDRPGIFYLFHRPRLWNPHERVWMGWERKRGKLEQFNALLLEARTAASATVRAGAALVAATPAPAAGTDPPFSDIVGDRSFFGSIKYVITLDTDTQLPRDAAYTLIGNMAHTLNRPVYDAKKGRVIDGYAILQPRASISLTSTSGSLVHAPVCGRSRHRSVHAGDLRCLPGPLRRRLVHRQGHLRRRGLLASRSRPFPGKPDPQPRPPGGWLRTLGSGDRRRSHRGASRQLCHGGQSEASVDKGRLAACRLAASSRTGAAMASGDRIRSRRCRSGSCSTTCAAASCRLLWWRCCWADGSGALGHRGCGNCWWSGRVPATRPADLGRRAGSQAGRVGMGGALGADRQVRDPSARALSAGRDLPAVRCAGLPGRHRPLGRGDALHPARPADVALALLQPPQRPSALRRAFSARCASALSWPSPWRCCCSSCRAPARPTGRSSSRCWCSGWCRPSSAGGSACLCTRPRRAWASSSRCSCVRWRDGRGATSPISSVPSTTGCRLTTTRSIRLRRWPRARLPRTWGWRFWRIWPRTTSDTSPPASSCGRTERALKTMEKLERFRGHFYNWYDTQHAAAAPPAVHLLGGQRQSGRQPARLAGGPQAS